MDDRPILRNRIIAAYALVACMGPSRVHEMPFIERTVRGDGVTPRSPRSAPRKLGLSGKRR